jgi:predicted SnoaL-like aldol condensation-catalyzing enzyme
VAVGSVSAAGGGAATDQQQRNKEAARCLYAEALGEGRFEVIDEVVATDFVNHTDPTSPRGPRGVHEVFRAIRRVAPDYRFTIEHLIAEDDLVVVHGRGVTGVMRGEFAGQDVTGGSDDAVHVHILRFRAGRAVEHRGIRQDQGL